ncbi:hypothetical protein [Nocardia nova]|uniref:hypothetical protein n=1 Tax=Nocardia nova TaxID=37330 RepID=UPI0021581640|nr:hypothetical protein [Nocardia nova]
MQVDHLRRCLQIQQPVAGAQIEKRSLPLSDACRSGVGRVQDFVVLVLCPKLTGQFQHDSADFRRLGGSNGGDVIEAGQGAYTASPGSSDVDNSGQ